MDTIIKIIKATKDNFNDIHQLTLGFTAFNAELSGDPAEFYYEGWEEGFKEEINDSLDDKNSDFFIAYVDDKPAGYTLCRFCESCYKFELDELYVDPAFRKHGLGKRLLNSAIELGKTFNVPIILEVYDWNTNAAEFYLKNGFKSDGKVLKFTE